MIGELNSGTAILSNPPRADFRHPPGGAPFRRRGGRYAVNLLSISGQEGSNRTLNLIRWGHVYLI